MGHKKKNDKWVKKRESRCTEGVDSTVLEFSHTRPISPPQPQKPSTSTNAFQLSDD